MAHVQDRGEKTTGGRRVRTDRYGKGRRWQARYHDPDGRERTEDFDRKQDAERFLAMITAEVLRVAYVDPNAGKVSFAEFAARWLEAQTFGESSREATEIRLRRHANAHFGRRELRSIKPSTIQAWLRKLQQSLAPSYVRAIFTNVPAVFSAAVDDGLIASNPAGRARSNHRRSPSERSSRGRSSRSKRWSAPSPSDTPSASSLPAVGSARARRSA